MIRPIAEKMLIVWCESASASSAPMIATGIENMITSGVRNEPYSTTIRQ